VYELVAKYLVSRAYADQSKLNSEEKSVSHTETSINTQPSPASPSLSHPGTPVSPGGKCFGSFHKN